MDQVKYKVCRSRTYPGFDEHASLYLSLAGLADEQSHQPMIGQHKSRFVTELTGSEPRARLQRLPFIRRLHYRT